MATARARRRDKKFVELVHQNENLQRDISDLETAYLLHRQFVEEDQNSVHGILRKEIGGSRWEHGGAGKLRMYKSSKDLEPAVSEKKQPHSTRTVPSSRQNGSTASVSQQAASINGNQRTSQKDGKDNIELLSCNVDRDRLLDLKTKVLKKAGSKIIRRESWASPIESNAKKKFTTEKEPVVENKVLSSKPVKKVRRTRSLKRDSSASSVKDTQKISKNDDSLIVNGAHGLSNNDDKKQPLERQSRLDLHKSRDLESSRSVSINASNGEVSNRSRRHSLREDVANSREFVRDVQCTPRQIEPRESLFQTQVPDQADLVIDTKHGEIRIKPSCDGQDFTHGDLNNSRVTIRPGSVNKSVDSHKIPCSIVGDNLCSSPSNEVRDIFGLTSIDPEFRTGAQQQKESSSPFAAAKNCNTEVEFWLRGLGLPDINKYVAIFAANDVDLLDLEFMSAAQLHDMGITSIGVLDKILKGVHDLRSCGGPLTAEASKAKKKGLTAASVAWEPIDETVLKTTASASNNKPKSVNKSCQNDTFLRRSNDDLLSRRSLDLSSLRSDRASVRSSSVMSNVSESTDMVSSARFAASTKSSSAKAVEKRPPSAKMIVKNSIGNQSGNKNLDSTRTLTQSPATVHRSNSTASEKQSSKLTSLESKPSKGVLIRPRSASVSRDQGKNSKKVNKEDDKEVKGRSHRTRYRSRSVDAVKRKALEGVQAAAKKFEDKQQRGHDQDSMPGVNDERAKHRRDLMAARHLQRERERDKEDTSGWMVSEESQTGVVVQTHSGGGEGQGLENLVTINVLANHSPGSDPDRSPREVRDRTTVVQSKSRDLRHSLRRVEPVKRQQRNCLQPVELPLDLDLPVLSTYKIAGKDREKAVSETESGYRTDGSYSQIEERVSEIQQQIKKLKARASTGDEMTLTLVRDLQAQLVHFEQQLLDKEQGSNSRPVEVRTPHQTNARGKLQTPLQSNQQIETSSKLETKGGKDSQRNSSRNVKTATQAQNCEQKPTAVTKETQMFYSDNDQSRRNDKGDNPVLIPKPTPRRVGSSRTNDRETSPSKQRAPGFGVTQTFKPISMAIPKMADRSQCDDDLTCSERETDVGEEEEKRETRRDGVRMSRKELLEEMQKEKQQHHQQIRQLQSELQRIRHTDPVSSLELSPQDIVFKQEDLIGEGTFSHVFRGEYQGSEVAVKRLKVPLLSHDQNYFRAEVSLLKELRHPRVVLLLGVCTSGKLPIMVLEFMSRGNLFNYLHNPDNESLDHALYYQVAKDIASGMNYLHNHKPEVLHLDLKSMNVLLCQSLRAKIADFGFSKLRHDVSQKTGRKVKTRAPQGSPVWMAPEMLDKGDVTSKADVYSFAIVLWEMVTRKIPYGDCSLFQILERVRKNQRPEIPASIPVSLSKFISQCWDRNPAKRPQFKDVIVTLEQLAFPPAWRELFVEAGIPDAALQNIQSTRTIINLVANTLDSSESVKLQNFMIQQDPHDPQGHHPGAFLGECPTSYQAQPTTTDKISNRNSRVHDDWECETVSTISDRSTGTVKNMHLSLRESSGEERGSSEDSDSSSVVSSEVDTIIASPAHGKDPPKQKLNVFIPSLELSLQTAREEFKAEREKIDRISDWFSISMDDRSSRSDQAGVVNTSVREFSGELSSKDLSNRSSRSTTPTSFRESSRSSASLNKSARTKRRNKTKDLTMCTEEQLMRESVDNRRPPSPFKKKSGTPKLLDSSRSSEINSTSDTGRSSICTERSSVDSERKKDDTDRSKIESEKLRIETELAKIESERSRLETPKSDTNRIVSTKPSVSGDSVSSQGRCRIPDNDFSNDLIGELKNHQNNSAISNARNSMLAQLKEGSDKSKKNSRPSDILSNRSSRTTCTVDSSVDSFFGISLNERTNSGPLTLEPSKESVANSSSCIGVNSAEMKANKTVQASNRQNASDNFEDVTNESVTSSRLIASSIASMQEFLGSENFKPSNIQESKSPLASARDNMNGDARKTQEKVSTSQVIGEYIGEMINPSYKNSNDMENTQSKSVIEIKVRQNGETGEVKESQPDEQSEKNKTQTNDLRVNEQLTKEKQSDTKDSNEHVRVKLDLSELEKKKYDLKSSMNGSMPSPRRASLDPFERKKPAITPRKSKLVCQSVSLDVEMAVSEHDERTAQSAEYVTNPRTPMQRETKITGLTEVNNENPKNVNEHNRKGHRRRDSHGKPKIDLGMDEFKIMSDGEKTKKPEGFEKADEHNIVSSKEEKMANQENISKNEELPVKAKTNKTQTLTNIEKSDMRVNLSNPDDVIKDQDDKNKLELGTVSKKTDSPKKNVIRVKLRKDPLAQSDPASSDFKINTKQTDVQTNHTSQSRSKQIVKIKKSENSPVSVNRGADRKPEPHGEGIRVKLMKDPLAPSLCRSTASPIPPPPPPPPPPPIPISQSLNSMPSQKKPSKPGSLSMADELRSRLSDRKSISEGLPFQSRTNSGRPVKSGNVIGRGGGVATGATRKQPLVSGCHGDEYDELDDVLVPLQSDGLPSFMVQSMDLRDQKEQLRSISRQHPQQLDEPLCHASKEKLSTIAEILKKAVMERRFAMHEDGDSVSQSLDSCATGWSIDTGI